MNKNKVIKEAKKYVKDEEIDPENISTECAVDIVNHLEGKDLLLFGLCDRQNDACDYWIEAAICFNIKLGDHSKHVGVVFNYNVNLCCNFDDLMEQLEFMEADAELIAEALEPVRYKRK